MKNKILTTIALLLINVICAQDYTMSLEGITKVVISSETIIIVKPNDDSTFLIKASENYRNNIAEKSKGLKSISNVGNDNTNYGVEVKKEGNRLIVKGLRERREASLVIRLPKTINVSVESLANNGVYVSGFNSEIEVINHHGETLLSEITGPIVAENGNGSIKVIFSTLNQSSPMSIVADNGDIDVSMPSKASATIHAKTPRGEFFTDFDLTLDRATTSTRVKTVKGNLNNGGVTISLQNLKGNIYLRQQ